ncbi:MAG: hypothetical protein U1F52_21910 [Burkholderiales bacterium]
MVNRRGVVPVLGAVLMTLAVPGPAARADDPVPPARKLKEAKDTRERMTDALSIGEKGVQGSWATGQFSADYQSRRALASMMPGQVGQAAGHHNQSRILGKASDVTGKVFGGVTLTVKCSGLANGTDQGDCAQGIVDAGAGELAGFATKRIIMMSGSQALATASGGAIAAAGFAGSLAGDFINKNAHQVFPGLEGKPVNEVLTDKVYLPLSKPGFDAYESVLNVQACGFADCTSQAAIDAHGQKLRDRDAVQRLQQAVEQGEPWALDLQASMRQQSEAAARQAVREASNPLEILDSAVFGAPASAVGGSVENDLRLRPEALIRKYDPQSPASARARLSAMKQSYTQIQAQQQQAAEAAADAANAEPVGAAGSGGAGGFLDFLGALTNAAVRLSGQRNGAEPKAVTSAGGSCTLDPATGCHPGHDEQAHPGGCKC